jgi:hypothetical protein
MEDGAIGVNSLHAASPVEKGLKIRPDSATIHHLLTEEQIALEKILTQLLAMIRPALLVTQFHKCFEHLTLYYNLRSKQWI